MEPRTRSISAGPSDLAPPAGLATACAARKPRAAQPDSEAPRLQGRDATPQLAFAQVVVGATGSWVARLAGIDPLWFTPVRMAICVGAGYLAAGRGASALRAGLVVAGVDAALGVLTLGYGARLDLSPLFASHKVAAVLLACVAGALLGGLGKWIRVIGGHRD